MFLVLEDSAFIFGPYKFDFLILIPISFFYFNCDPHLIFYTFLVLTSLYFFLILISINMDLWEL